MKIIVSHSQKQHSYRLAYALQKNNLLKKFFTSIYAKKTYKVFNFFEKSSFYKKLEVKRNFVGLNSKNISLSIIPELYYQIFRKFNSKKSSYVADRLHDYIVSFKLLFIDDYDYIIGYERQSYLSFLISKKRNKINILDLATIHAKEIIEINNKNNGLVMGFSNSDFLEFELIIKEKEYLLADHFLVLSEYAKNTYVKYGIDPKKIHTVNLGIDLTNFKQKNSYENNMFEILIVSGVRYLKGIKDLIEVVKELLIPNFKLTIIGGHGDAINYVKENLSDNINYINYLEHDKLKEQYKKASIFVLPSYMDSWAQVVCEAMATGTPVIVSENTGAKDVIQNGENGFIINTGDREELKDKILYFYKNKTEIERMGKNARKTVEKYTWDSYYKSVNKIMEKIKSV